MRFMRTTCRHVWFRSMNAAICANHLEIDSNCQPNELIILRPYKYIFLLSGKCWVIFYLWCRYSHRFSMDLILLDRIIYILRANRKKTEIPYCWEVLWCLESCFIFMNAFHSKWLAKANVSQMFFFFFKLPSLPSENSTVNYFVIKQISLRQMRVYFRPKHNGMGLDLKGHLQRWHWNS